MPIRLDVGGRLARKGAKFFCFFFALEKLTFN